MKNLQSFKTVCGYLPPCIRKNIIQLSESDVDGINEIRIRLGKPVSICFSDRTCFLTKSGGLADKFDSSCCVIPGKAEMDEIFSSLCRYSVHSFSRELAQGFFTVANGVRVGISGTVSPTEKRMIQCVSGLNFRISREIIGCAEGIYDRIFSGGTKSILICGGVNTGKTTILRDLCRICGNSSKVTLIDERNEISATVSGISTNDIGLQTDVIVGCERDAGIISAVRTLSPELIFCDELCDSADADAIMGGAGCGVKFAATVHADCFEDLHRRVFLKRLLENGVFDYAVILEGCSLPGKVKEIRRMK